MATPPLSRLKGSYDTQGGRVSAQQDLRKLLRHGNGGNYLTGKVMRYLQEFGEVDFSTDDRVRDIMVGIMSAKRVRLPGLHPSQLFQCSRRQMFDYMSLPVPGPQIRNHDLQNIFNNGTWGHYRWQTMLLLIGVIHGVEVPVRDPLRRIVGSMDGEGIDLQKLLWMFEFKTVHHLHPGLPLRDHLLQKHSYFVGKPALDYGIIVYEDKGTQRFTEERVEKNPAMMRQVNRRIDRLNRYIDERQLPDVLPDCKAKKGPEYKECPYSSCCATYQGWDRLEEDGTDPEATPSPVAITGRRRVRKPAKVSA